MSKLFAWEYEGLLTKEAAQALLMAVSDLFYEAIHAAWDEWLSLPVNTRLKISAMQRGGFVHDLIVFHAKDKLSTASKIEIAQTTPFFAVYVNDDTIVRFKKLQEDYVAVPATEHGKLFYNNAPMSCLRPFCNRLTCGYVLDRFGNEVVDIAFTLQVRDEVVWKISLSEMAYAPDSPDHSPEPQAPVIQPLAPPSQAEEF
ncbi:MAG: hypothetical protein KF774_00535 [Planctomyces sp.]|nr:hypothetical protein [Planctomyces sp.]